MTLLAKWAHNVFLFLLSLAALRLIPMSTSKSSISGITYFLENYVAAIYYLIASCEGNASL
jgi:hypothetical protein